MSGLLSNLDEDPDEALARLAVIRHELARRRRAAEAARQPRIVIAEKRCPKCEEVKPADAFGVDTSRPDGRHVYCRECR